MLRRPWAPPEPETDVGTTTRMTKAAPAKPPRRTPIRTCVACRTSGGKRTLVRVVRLPAGESDTPQQGAGVVLDPGGKQSGRGAYVCPAEACVEQALKQKKLERSLKTPIPEAVAGALRALAAQAATHSPPQQPPPTSSAAPDTTAGSGAAA